MFQARNLEVISRQVFPIMHVNRIIYTKRKCLPNSCQVKNGETIIEQVNSTKFLGVIIDYRLSWNEHINYIKGKIAKGIGIVCKARRFFQKSTLLTMYNTFIYPYFTYCVEVWGSSCKFNLQSLIKIQKRAVRIITLCKPREHTAPLFVKLKVFNVHNIYLYKVMLFMFKFMRGLMPGTVDDLFSRNSDVHGYSTRQSSKLR